MHNITYKSPLAVLDITRSITLSCFCVQLNQVKLQSNLILFNKNESISQRPILLLQPATRETKGFQTQGKLKRLIIIISLSCAEISTASNVYKISKPNMFDLYSKWTTFFVYQTVRVFNDNCKHNILLERIFLSTQENDQRII